MLCENITTFSSVRAVKAFELSGFLTFKSLMAPKRALLIIHTKAATAFVDIRNSFGSCNVDQFELVEKFTEVECVWTEETVDIYKYWVENWNEINIFIWLDCCALRGMSSGLMVMWYPISYLLVISRRNSSSLWFYLQNKNTHWAFFFFFFFFQIFFIDVSVKKYMDIYMIGFSSVMSTLILNSELCSVHCPVFHLACPLTSAKNVFHVTRDIVSRKLNSCHAATHIWMCVLRSKQMAPCNSCRNDSA